MHEFSIIQNIINIVTETAMAHHVKSVHAVEVEVGQASGVIHDALEFAWEAASKDTLLENSQLKITEIPLRIKCTICEHQYQPCDMYESCPGCGEISPEIITGKELRVVAIET